MTNKFQVLETENRFERFCNVYYIIFGVEKEAVIIRRYKKIKCAFICNKFSNLHIL